MAKQKTVTLRFSEAEVEKINDAAKARGIDRSKYIRERLLGSDSSNPSIYDNQMRRCMHTLKYVHKSLDDICRDDEQVKKQVKDIKKEIEEIWLFSNR